MFGLFANKIEFCYNNLINNLNNYLNNNLNNNMNCNTTNEVDLDLFLCEIDKAILSGNTTFITNAIKKYENIITKSYILWANTIALQIIEEQLDELEI